MKSACWPKAILLTIVLAFILAGCGGSSSDSDVSKRIYILKSESGTLVKTDTAEKTLGSQYTLTLSGVDETSLWYTDRPEKDTGTQAVSKYVEDEWDKMYGDITPNAVVQFYKDDGMGGLFLDLSDPVYDQVSGTLIFSARLLNKTMADLPDTFDIPLPVVSVLNNVEDQQEAASFLLYAQESRLNQDQETGTATLSMEGVYASVVQVDNAPGRYSGADTLSNLVARWDDYYKNSPPNAVVYGYNSQNQVALFFVTLHDPVYLADESRLTFTAEHLDHASEDFTPLYWSIMNLDAVELTRFPSRGKGECYEAFGKNYSPSTANDSWIYFGSDIARDQCGALWGNTTNLHESSSNCRKDLQTMKNDMGVNMVRLYDWDQRNDHSKFLDMCNDLGMKVVVPISNWLPQNPEFWDAQVSNYFNSTNFGNSDGSNWHPAIVGVVIGNEPTINGVKYANVINLVAAFLGNATALRFSDNVLVGAPLSFGIVDSPPEFNGKHMPCWTLFDQLVNNASLSSYRSQLMLCANTYNGQDYLFDNAEGTGTGWVPATYQQFGLPILFTEIGLSRLEPVYKSNPTFVQDQLSGTMAWQKSNPGQLLGACHFMFSDKSWLNATTQAEGAFGAFSHHTPVDSLQCIHADFNFYPGTSAGDNYGVLDIDVLKQTTTYQQVVNGYTTSD